MNIQQNSRSGSGHAAQNETHSPSLGMRNEHHTPTTSAVDYQHFDMGIGQVSYLYKYIYLSSTTVSNIDNKSAF